MVIQPSALFGTRNRTEVLLSLRLLEETWASELALLLGLNLSLVQGILKAYEPRAREDAALHLERALRRRRRALRAAVEARERGRRVAATPGEATAPTAAEWEGAVIGPNASLGDVALEVCTALHEAGTTAVLSGGSAATWYAPDAYQSFDLDFIITLHGPGGGEVLRALGFVESGQIYRHPATHFTLDFPKGPLAVGEDTLSEWRTERRGDQLLHVLTPTDACRDRLASFLFWNDFSGLEQALAVANARRREVELPLIEDWCRRERHSPKFELFKARLGAPVGSPARR